MSVACPYQNQQWVWNKASDDTPATSSHHGPTHIQTRTWPQMVMYHWTRPVFEPAQSS